MQSGDAQGGLSGWRAAQGVGQAGPWPGEDEHLRVDNGKLEQERMGLRPALGHFPAPEAGLRAGTETDWQSGRTQERASMGSQGIILKVVIYRYSSKETVNSRRAGVLADWIMMS